MVFFTYFIFYLILLLIFRFRPIPPTMSILYKNTGSQLTSTQYFRQTFVCKVDKQTNIPVNTLIFSHGPYVCNPRSKSPYTKFSFMNWGDSWAKPMHLLFSCIHISGHFKENPKFRSTIYTYSYMHMYICTHLALHNVKPLKQKGIPR